MAELSSHTTKLSRMGTGHSFPLLPSSRHLQSAQLGVQRKQEDSSWPYKLCRVCQPGREHRPTAVARRPWGRMMGLVRSRKPRGKLEVLPKPSHGVGKAASSSAMFPEAGPHHAALTAPTGTARGHGDIPSPAQPMVRVAASYASPPIRAGRAGLQPQPFSQGAAQGMSSGKPFIPCSVPYRCHIQPGTHLCRRTCRPSRCDRCTARAGGRSRGGTPACARTPRSARPPSPDRTWGMGQEMG